MKVGAVILCRYNSSRLPGKILKPINEQPILYHIIKRLESVTGLELIVATSSESSDDPIEVFCTQHKVKLYRGSLENVASRFYEAANSQNWDYAIRVNGDNLFIDTAAINSMVNITTNGSYDFVSNVKDRTFPYGMSIEILKLDFYKSIIGDLNTAYYQEHVTIYLYENEEVGKRYYFYNHTYQNLQGWKLAIDTQEDFIKAETILKEYDLNLNHYTLADLSAIATKMNT